MPKLKTQEPTSKQRKLLIYISKHIDKKGYQPSIREMMSVFGVTSPNGIACHLRALQKKGYIKLGKNYSRCIELDWRYWVHASSKR